MNFWQPSGGRGLRAVPPARLAWEAFGVRSGVRDFDEMRARVEKYWRRFARGRPNAPATTTSAAMVAGPGMDGALSPGR